MNIKIIVINLKSSSGRRARISKQLDTLGIPYEFLEATEGNKLTNDWIEDNIGDRLKKIYFNSGHHLITSNALACADSHRRAQLIASEFEHGYTLVLEDDVKIARGFKKKILNVINLMSKHSLHISFIGCNWSKGARKKRNDINCSGFGFSFYRYPIDGHVSGAYAYVLDSEGAKKLVGENIEKIQYMADTFRLQEKNLTNSTVVVYPKIITTGYFVSDIGYDASRINVTKRIKLKVTHSKFLDSAIGYYLLSSWKERRW